MPAARSSPFGALLRRYRLAAGLTQEGLAERAGVSARGVQNLESGVSQSPRHDTLDMLAAALDLSEIERAAFAGAARAPHAPAPAPRAGALIPLVGRRRELEQLARFLDQPSADEAPTPVLVVAGEPGIGKTRLLQAASQMAVARGWSVLAGGCQRRGGQESFSPITGALSRQLRALPTEERRAVLHGCGWLRPALPELADDFEPPPAASHPEQERRLLFAAAARCLARLSGPTGTVLVLDDLQWAESDAIDMLAALVRSDAFGADGFRVVAAYRDTEVLPTEPLGHLLADLAHARLVRRLPLEPLERADAAELLADLLFDGAEKGAADGRTIESALARADGLPFFLISYAHALRAGHEQGASMAASMTPPWDVAQGLRQRVSLLPEQGRTLLGIAAVIGRRTPWELLATVSGLDEDDLLAGLDAACRSRLLREEDDGTYAFAHDVIREVVEADLGAARRAMLHRRVGSALEAAPSMGSVEALAYHFARAGLSERAVPYLERAGDRAWERLGLGAAEEHYRDAAERLEAMGRNTEAARVRVKLGEALYRAGRHEAVIEAVLPAVEPLRAADDWDALARVAGRLGWSYTWRGRPDDGLAVIEPLIAALERRDDVPEAPAHLAALYEAVGQLLFGGARLIEALAAHERSAAYARASGDDRLCATSDSHRANLLQALGRQREALLVGHQALELADSAGDLEVLRRCDADLAVFHALHGEFEAGRNHIERAVEISSQMGDLVQLAWALTFRGWIALMTGDLNAARTDLVQALGFAGQVDGRIVLAYCRIVLALVAMAEEDVATAMLEARDAVALATANRDAQALHWAAGVVAQLELLAGRPEAALAGLLPVLGDVHREAHDVTAQLPVLAWALLEAGRLDEADEIVALALARVIPEEIRLVQVDALRIQAHIAARRSRPAEAARCLDDALALARSTGYRYAVAQLNHDRNLASRNASPTA